MDKSSDDRSYRRGVCISCYQMGFDKMETGGYVRPTKSSLSYAAGTFRQLNNRIHSGLIVIRETVCCLPVTDGYRGRMEEPNSVTIAKVLQPPRQMIFERP
jgi:hypothetical protein